MGHAPNHGTRVIPLGQQTQVVEVVSDELVSVELDAKQRDAAGGGGRFM
jgi:hypothetical protein